MVQVLSPNPYCTGAAAHPRPDSRTTERRAMDTQESTSREFLFKPRQFLGAPLVQAPPKAGYISAAVQFTVPALAVGKSQHAAVLKLCERLGRQTYAAAIKRVTADDTKQVGTLVAITFHVPESETNEVV